MKFFLSLIMAMCLSMPAFAVGHCVKPATPLLPENAPVLSQSELLNIQNENRRWFAEGKTYLDCLESLIMGAADPSDPIINKAGYAHKDFSEKRAETYGVVVLACLDWEDAHGARISGGCAPVDSL